MTTPEALWGTDHDGIAVPTDTPAPGAVKYIRADLAQWPKPRPIVDSMRAAMRKEKT